MNNQSKCICNGDIYVEGCPQSFVQGGMRLHTVDDGFPPGRVVDTPNAGAQQAEVEDYLTQQIKSYSIDNDATRPLNTPMARPVNTSRMPKYTDNVSADGLMAANRATLNRFEPLQVDGLSLTRMTIGGFPVDMALAAKKAKEIAPLPPSKLPIIFVDGELNFLHHFFQGMEILLGRTTLESMVQKQYYSAGSDQLLAGHVKSLISVGYERHDNEMTLFTKKCLLATFKWSQELSEGIGEDVFIVEANLYGFQYLESGMQCKEEDLRMWLSVSYGHYRTSWFNNFKSSGIPSFALHGVQTRYGTASQALDGGVVKLRGSRPQETGEPSLGQEVTRSRHGRRKHRTIESDTDVSRVYGKRSAWFA